MKILLSFLAFILVGCASSKELIPSQSPAHQATYYMVLTNTPTNTYEPSSTSTNTPMSTITPTLTKTPPPSPTYTNTPTSTPEPGTFQNPAIIGEVIERTTGEDVLPPEKQTTIQTTLLEVQRGDAANQVAQSILKWPYYQQPIEGQEYIALKLIIDVVKANPNEVYTLYSYFSYTLRYEEDGSDIWSIDYYGCSETEGYPPITCETWVFFLIRQGSQPLLYFQPDLIVFEQFGVRTTGAYFLLE